MILVSLGTHKLGFNRLLKEIDNLIEEKVITEEALVQTGYSDYKPKHFKAIDFMEMDEFEELIEKSSYIIAHGGTGIISRCLKMGKKVIAVPRLQRHGEHVDDHQLEIIGQFARNNQIIGLSDVSELREAIKRLMTFIPEPYTQGNSGIIKILNEFVAEDL